MTTLQWIKIAAVYALIFALGLTTIWWLLFRRRSQPLSVTKARLSDAEIEKSELGLSLPKAYAAFLRRQRPDHIDGTSVIADASRIILLTMEYRKGYGGAPPWPANYVYIGDESDACPYALDAEKETVVHTDHGHLGKPPLHRYSSFHSFLRGFSAK
jgi:hypothetical protein